MKNLRIIVGHGIGLRPTRKEREFSNKRKEYREELQQLRNEIGIFIPFGANLEKFKRVRMIVHKIDKKKSSEYHLKPLCGQDISDKRGHYFAHETKEITNNYHINCPECLKLLTPIDA